MSQCGRSWCRRDNQCVECERDTFRRPGVVAALLTAERHFLDTVWDHGLGPGVGECQEAWAGVVQAREALETLDNEPEVCSPKDQATDPP